MAWSDAARAAAAEARRLHRIGQAVASRTEGAYSYDRYKNWGAVAKMLVKRGYSGRAAVDILASKYTRWAADSSGKRYGSATSKDLAKFLDKNNPARDLEWTARGIRPYRYKKNRK